MPVVAVMRIGRTLIGIVVPIGTKSEVVIRGVTRRLRQIRRQLRPRVGIEQRLWQQLLFLPPSVVQPEPAEASRVTERGVPPRRALDDSDERTVLELERAQALGRRDLRGHRARAGRTDPKELSEHQVFGTV